MARREAAEELMTSSLFASSIRPNKWGKTYSPAGVYIPVNGTGDPSPFDTYNQLGSFASDVGQLLMQEQDGLWAYQPIGYEAAVENMEQSYTDAANQIIAALGGPPCASYQAEVYDSGPVVLGGYSQGTCAINLVWHQAVFPADGVLHRRIDDFMFLLNFGDVNRCAGIANGNAYQGIPAPKEVDGLPSGGIAQSTGSAPVNLTEAESTYVNPTNPLGLPVVMSWALDADIYGSSSQGPAGKVGKSIMKVVFVTGFGEVVEVVLDLEYPVGILMEILRAAGFFAANTSAPHWQYANAGCVASAAQLMLALGNSLPHAPGF
jgi:hypothetical protein